MPTKAVLLLKVEQLSPLIRSLREEKGWTQARLAHELNTTQQVVSRMGKDASGLAFARVYETLPVLDHPCARGNSGRMPHSYSRHNR